MARLGALHFYPQRIAWIGSVTLGIGLAVAIPFLVMIYMADSPVVTIQNKKEIEKTIPPFSFSLGLSGKVPVLPTPDLLGEMTFSFDPPRPDAVFTGNRLLVRLKKSTESRRMALPCRLDLEFQRDKLVFANEKSPFWIDLTLNGVGLIEGKGFIASHDGSKIDAGSFTICAQESPFQTAQEFPEGSPFRLLAETKWWGRDLLREQGTGERLEIGANEIIELKEGDWLLWKEQKWEKSLAPQKDIPIAHIQSFSGKALIFEGWDSNAHVRIPVNLAVATPFKIRGEELFSAIRIRSEKQISCMLEKQCMVLKTGDWVLKAGGRWKMLRKEQEREAFLSGKLLGELFIFDQISQKQNQKMILGRLFNPGRTQVVAIEMAAQSSRKAGEKGLKK